MSSVGEEWYRQRKELGKCELGRVEQGSGRMNGGERYREQR